MDKLLENQKWNISVRYECVKQNLQICSNFEKWDLSSQTKTTYK